MSASARMRSRLAREGTLVIGEGIDLRRPVGAPPGVGAGHDTVIGLDQERRVLARVARGQDEARVPADPIPVSGVVEPLVTSVARPEVDHLGVREEPDVQACDRGGDA